MTHGKCKRCGDQIQSKSRKKLLYCGSGNLVGSCAYVIRLARLKAINELARAERLNLKAKKSPQKGKHYDTFMANKDAMRWLNF